MSSALKTVAPDPSLCQQTLQIPPWELDQLQKWVPSLGGEDPPLMEEEMATHSSILAWEVP